MKTAMPGTNKQPTTNQIAFAPSIIGNYNHVAFCITIPDVRLSVSKCLNQSKSMCGGKMFGLRNKPNKNKHPTMETVKMVNFSALNLRWLLD